MSDVIDPVDRINNERTGNRRKHEAKVKNVILGLMYHWHERVFRKCRYASSGERFRIATRDAIAPALAAIYVAAGKHLLYSLDQDIREPMDDFEWQSWSLKLAKKQATTFVDELLPATTTMIENMQAIENPLTDQNNEEIDRIFGSDRATLEGITETTRAISLAEYSLRNIIDDQLGIMLAPYWRVDNGNRECLACNALDGMREQGFRWQHPFGPPGVKGCRCGLKWCRV